VGKTSLGRSVARALGRKFVRISLGGVHDEAEIRGHRRTYVGALPGRIVQGLRKAETINPVFMLDEVDKIGRDFRGDPSAALLEVLDPEQNDSFSDHYLELPLDLSKVLFVTTANLLDPINSALKDRMEVIEIPGYTFHEKEHIARGYLIPKQIEAHGLESDQIEFTDEALSEIINRYTREAGVRNLERRLADVCRGVAVRVAETIDRQIEAAVESVEESIHEPAARAGDAPEAERAAAEPAGGADEKTVAVEFEKVAISKANLQDFLGPERFSYDVAERTSDPGVATGLAWTASGGDILFIESTKMKGRGELTLTGQLGDVMKESARAALSYIRSRTDEYGIDPDFLKETDIHIHVPAGAIPKDGPSAGITMYSSLLSLLTGIKVRDDVAMTGEITLRGNILPVGGIKEKVLAAHRAGLRHVILPERNKKDMVDVSEEIKDEMTFHFVSKMAELPELVLEQPPEPIGQGAEAAA
jgi:ATP-dependent Lon protease